MSALDGWIDICRAGSWRDMAGRDVRLDEDRLDRIVAAQAAADPTPVVVGHADSPGVPLPRGAGSDGARAPLIAALAGLVPDHAEDEGPDALAVEGALAANASLWLELAARACGRDVAWLARLSDADGRALSEAMWAANGEFFLRRVAAQVTAQATAGEWSPCRSTACSTPSSAPVTDAGTTTSASA